MRTITDEMGRLLARAPINGCSKLAWEVSTVLAEYDQKKREVDAKASRQEEHGLDAAARFAQTKANIDRALGRRSRD